MHVHWHHYFHPLMHVDNGLMEFRFLLALKVCILGLDLLEVEGELNIQIF
jgi:hypothetical protein